MKLGFLTSYSENVVKFASEIGFTSLSLQGGPGSTLDATKLTAEDKKRVREVAKKYGITISALGWYTNPLDPNESKRKEIQDYLMKLFDLCKELGVGVYTGFPGGGTTGSVANQGTLFKEVWAPLVDKAEACGIKIAFENCRGGGASRPADWDEMFRQISSPVLGLELDPSHLVLQFIDYLAAVRDYGGRIHHIHAKDTEIRGHILAREGIYGHGWWRFRIPGWGDIDWQKFIAALLDVGYDGAISIEHEDPVFHGERFNEGLILGFKHLSRFIKL